MTHPYFAERLIAEHDRTVRAASARARLIELARCCQPSRIAAALQAARRRTRAGTSGTAVCCA